MTCSCERDCRDVLRVGVSMGRAWSLSRAANGVAATDATNSRRVSPALFGEVRTLSCRSRSESALIVVVIPSGGLKGRSRGIALIRVEGSVPLSG